MHFQCPPNTIVVLKPAEVLVSDEDISLIRERETFADLLSKQNVPVRLLK